MLLVTVREVGVLLKQMPIREQITHKVCMQGENCELRHAQQILAS